MVDVIGPLVFSALITGGLAFYWLWTEKPSRKTFEVNYVKPQQIPHLSLKELQRLREVAPSDGTA